MENGLKNKTFKEIKSVLNTLPEDIQAEIEERVNEIENALNKEEKPSRKDEMTKAEVKKPADATANKRKSALINLTGL